MPPASHRPDLPRSGAPLSVLVDFDGTVSRLDVGDALLDRHVADQAAVRAQDARYDAGEIGSRELMRWDMDVLPRDAGLLRREALAMPLDGTLAELVAVVRDVDGALEVVSDGLGFYVEELLARDGFGDLPVATNRAVPGEGGAAVVFPYGHPTCHVCGTCKRERVLRHRAAGRAVVLVGDGTSDRYAAAHADVTFAKDSLARFCDRAGWPYVAWERLADVADWLRDALGDGRLPRDPGGYPAWRERHPVDPWGFICGPEAWGEGRTRPAG
jgi:2-hydroxy-3-keto-5-methylthiopentenyl-1-phosphate phosphatase